jgi:hypothetical protein
MRGQPWARPPPGPGPAPSNPPPSHGDTHMRTPPRCFSTRTLISMTAQAPRPEDGPCVDGAADLVRPIIMDRDSDSESPFQCQCRLTQYWLMAEAFRRPARFAPLAGACRPGGLARSATRTMPVGLGDSRPRFPQIARDRDRDRETRRLRPGLGPVPASRVAAAGQVRVRLGHYSTEIWGHEGQCHTLRITLYTGPHLLA